MAAKYSISTISSLIVVGLTLLFLCVGTDVTSWAVFEGSIRYGGSRDAPQFDLNIHAGLQEECVSTDNAVETCYRYHCDQPDPLLFGWSDSDDDDTDDDDDRIIALRAKRKSYKEKCQQVKSAYGTAAAACVFTSIVLALLATSLVNNTMGLQYAILVCLFLAFALSVSAIGTAQDSITYFDDVLKQLTYNQVELTHGPAFGVFVTATALSFVVFIWRIVVVVLMCARGGLQGEYTALPQ